jgi:SOS response regulatory protein OraA/RecX
MKGNFPSSRRGTASDEGGTGSTGSSRRRDYTPKAPPKTAREFYDLALKYCSKRETSRTRMESYLLRKARGGLRPLEDDDQEEANKVAIQEVLEQLIRQQVINDERYAGMLVRDFQRKAKGERYVKNKLREKGLSDQIGAVEHDEEAELERALQVIDKTVTKARFKKIEAPYELKQKLTQKLMQSGFDLTVSKKAVALRIR